MTPSPSGGPARVLDIELSRPLPDIDNDCPSGGVYASAFVLVRIHGMPIGICEVELAEGSLAAADLGRRILADLGESIQAHLAADGLPSPLSLESGSRGDDEPPCLEHRRSLFVDAPWVTVVVPAVDRPELLRRAVEDLQAQSYPSFDVIVVDNAPGRSGVRAAAEGMPAGPVNVRVLDETQPGSSPARNRGLAASTAAITAFVDADVRIDQHWLTELVAPIAADPLVGASSGLIVPAELETRAQIWMEEWGGYGKGFAPRVMDLDHRSAEGVLFPYSASLGSGQSMAFRTSSLKRAGGFDRALGVRTPARGGEDIAPLLEVVMAGERVAYAPGAIVWHPHPRGDEEFFAKLHDYGVGLTAHLMRFVVHHPGSLLDLGRRIPPALGYFFRVSSARNELRRPGFPSARVRRAELTGMALGPFAYLAGLARVRFTGLEARRPQPSA
jgi:GT2 family glycosyltransferase